MIITGWTGAGKTTLAGRLAAECHLRAVVASQGLLNAVGATDRPRLERLASWLDPNRQDPRSAAVDRRVDLALISAILSEDRPMVVESAGSVALLMPLLDQTFRVRLEASETVRAARIADLMAGRVSISEARTVVARKDAATAQAARDGWALDLRNDSAMHWRHDLVLRCPHAPECAAPARCQTAVDLLTLSAYWVYVSYLRADPQFGQAAARRLACEIEVWRAWVVRVSPLLTEPESRFDPDVWTRRLRHDLDNTPATESQVCP
ncbi:MAG: AAA family ATPase [Micromonosporaceae bacterium]